MKPIPTNVLLGWIPNILSILACLVLFWRYWTLDKKTNSLKMILVLAISQLVFHSFIIIAINHQMKSLYDYFAYPAIALLYFSLFWACNMAYFLNRMLILKPVESFFSYCCGSIVTILTISIGWCVLL